MTNCPDRLALEAFADGEGPEDRDAVAAHLETCAECAATVQEIGRLNDLVREAAMRARPAPPAPTVSPTRPRRFGRRAVLVGGGAMAASLAGMAMLDGSGRRGTFRERMIQTYFGDFRTLMAAERRLDIAETDLRRLLAWFGSRVAFETPVLGALDGLSLRGGRLCWLMDRRNAALDFETAQGGCCLYLAALDDPARWPEAEPVLAARDGLNGAFWRRGGVMHSLVGEPDGATLAAFASALRARA